MQEVLRVFEAFLIHSDARPTVMSGLGVGSCISSFIESLVVVETALGGNSGPMCDDRL